MLTGNDLLNAVKNLPSMVEEENKNDYNRAVTDCWNYLYYHRGMKDLAEEMYDFVHNQQEDK
jgi:endonuclease YncB( thermonuclease family)